jgi:hemoglobin
VTRRPCLLLLCAALATLLGAGCAQRGGDRLYRELGAEPGVARLVEALLGELAADERILHHFRSTDVDRLQRMLNEHLCHVAGGPCAYTGDSMPDVHGGMNISHAEFNALVEDLIAAMNSLDVPQRTQNRLLARLAPMRPQIVHR